MNMDVIETSVSRPRAVIRCVLNSHNPRNAASNRCNALLAEFLQGRSARKLANVQERADEATTLEVNMFRNQVLLPDELFFKIFISLPAESLIRIQLVCKKWFHLINSPAFMKSHALQSETVLICQELALSSQPLDEKPKSYFHFLDLHCSNDSFIESNETGLKHVLASCNGLVLGRPRTRNCLILTNPLTRKHVELPLGKAPTSLSSDGEAYYLVFCMNAKTYKVLHLFWQNPINACCEIMCSSTRTWRMIDGFSSDLLQPIKHVQVLVDGSLYWKPRKQRCDYCVTMNVHDEKFTTNKLPTSCDMKDQLLEFGGTVGLVTNATHHLMDIWIMMKDTENWIKKHTINLNSELRYIPSPFCSLRNGKDLVFEVRDCKIYVYDLDKGDMKLVHWRDDFEARSPGIEHLYIPHRKTLASLDDESS